MVSRRKFIQAGVASAAVAGGFPAPAISKGAKIKLGYVSPQSGPLAAFSIADNFAVKTFLESEVGKEFEIFVKDTQSNPNRAADITNELIVKDNVDLVLAASAPETVVPVSLTCESEEKPCLTTLCPWDTWYALLQANQQDKSTWESPEYAYHHFFGLPEVIPVFTNLFNQIESNRVVGGLFPNDSDGNAWADPKGAFFPVVEALGFEVVDGGRFQVLTDDFSSQLSKFKKENCELLIGVPIPPDFTTFWQQARQQGYNPKAAVIGKAILFPESMEAMGDAGHNLSLDVWWAPSFPYKSSVTGQSCAQFAADFTKATGKQWSQPIGYVHSLFELAADVMGRVDNVTNGDAVARAITETNVDTISGKVKFDGENLPDYASRNVANASAVGGQWKRKEDGKFDIAIVDNKTAPQIPLTGKMELLGG